MALTPEQKPLLIGAAKGWVIHRLHPDRQLDFRSFRQALAATAEFAFAGNKRETTGEIAGG
jgi:hypothetical protein